ncbi:MAG: inositol 2-dehydrogenase [Francisellaceae bacterium]
MLRMGLIGGGRIGRLHAYNLKRYFADRVLITHVYDPFIDDDWAAENELVVCDSVDALLNEAISAVLICSPSNEHVSQIIAAAENNKSIFCEKPIGLEIKEIQQAIDVTAKAGVLLQVGFNRRFDPSFAALKNRMDAEVGQPQLIKITSRDPHCPPERYIAHSGGIFLDMSIHDFDMARFLAQSEVKTVYATGSCLINPSFKQHDDIDTAVIQLKFKNGALAVIDNSRQAVYGYDQRIEVFSNKAALKADNKRAHHVEFYGSDEVKEAVFENFFLERYKEAYINQFSAFFAAIENQLPSAVSGFDGLAAVEIAKAARKSWQSGQAVSLSEHMD